MWHFDMPLAWRNGVMIATGLGCAVQVAAGDAPFARPPMTAAIGAMLGTLSPAIFEHADLCLLSLGGLVLQLQMPSFSVVGEHSVSLMLSSPE